MDQKRWASRAFVIFLLLAVCGAAAKAAPNKGVHAGAGPDQRVEAGARVVLSGSGRDAEGRPVRFSWVQIAGPRVSLDGPNRSTVRFAAPRVKVETVLKFRLVVTDRRGAKGSSVVTVTVVPKAPAKPPSERLS
ncbi:MAG: PKD domain-containing protein [Sulfurifustis sp.]